jgi:hypothetical protein
MFVAQGDKAKFRFPGPQRRGTGGTLELWRSNRIGQLDKEVGSGPSGCAMPGLSHRPPRSPRVDEDPLPRSPKARDRVHPRVVENPLEIRAFLKKMTHHR